MSKLDGRYAVPVLIVMFLASIVVSQSVVRITRAPGVDFYQFWGVPVAQRLTGHTLGSPYRDGKRYVETLRAYAGRANDTKLRAATAFWSGPDFAGSPLLYTVFSVVSSQYSFAVGVFQALQVFFVLGAFLLLGRLYRHDLFSMLCLALLCILFYNPLLSDFHVANLGALQLVYLAGLLWLGDAIGRVSAASRRMRLAALFLGALALLTLCKPTVVLISALLVVHLGVRYGPRLLLTAALPAVAVAAILFALPSWHFGSWAVWREWYDFVYGANPRMLVRPVTSGNYSTALLLSSWLGLDVFSVSLVLLALLTASLVAVAAWSARAGGAAASLALTAWAAVKRIFGDMSLVLAIGLVVTTVTSPLYWLHYYSLLLIPILWLLGTAGRSTTLPWLAVVATVLSSAMLEILLRPLQLGDTAPASIASSWLPLWGAVLIVVASPVADAPARTPDRAPEPRTAAAEPSTPAPRSRRRRR
jgi:hypothetical protein